MNFASHNTAYVNYFNVSEYITSDGSVAAHYEYDAFGNTISQTGAMADDFRFRFSSKYLDYETGLYYYGYRWYSPALGRWLSRDPIEERGGVNQYGACMNNPILFIDILGMTPENRGVRIGGVTRIPTTLFSTRTEMGATEITIYSAPICESCGDGCSKLVVDQDTEYFGYVEWLIGLENYKMKSGRTLKEHEMQHYADYQKQAKMIDDMLHSLADGTCVSTECCDAKNQYFYVYRALTEALTNHKRWKLELEDYSKDTIKDLEVNNRLDDAYKQIQGAVRARNIFKARMEAACS